MDDLRIREVDLLLKAMAFKPLQWQEFGRFILIPIQKRKSFILSIEIKKWNCIWKLVRCHQSLKLLNQ
jgi:hypothetical protein